MARDPAAHQVVLLPTLQGPVSSPVPSKGHGCGNMLTHSGSPQRTPLRDRGNDLPHAGPSLREQDKGADVQEGSMRASCIWLGGLAQGAIAPESDVTGRPAAALQQWRVERSCGDPAASACASGCPSGHCASVAAQFSTSPADAASEGSTHNLSQPRPGGMTQLLATRLALAAAAEPPSGPPPGWAESKEGIAARRAAATRAVNVPRGVTLYQRKSPGAARGPGKQPRGQADARVAEVKQGRRDTGAAGTRAVKSRQLAAARAVAGTVVPAPLMTDLWREEDHVVEVRRPDSLEMSEVICFLLWTAPSRIHMVGTTEV